MSGIDLVTLAAMLGHSRIQMVLRYAHQQNSIKPMPRAVLSSTPPPAPLRRLSKDQPQHSSIRRCQMVWSRYNCRYSRVLRFSEMPVNITLKEAAIGIEPMDKGFADLCLTTWLRRLVLSNEKAKASLKYSAFEMSPSP
jgi:hypothetical protein